MGIIEGDPVSPAQPEARKGSPLSIICFSLAPGAMDRAAAD